MAEFVIEFSPVIKYFGEDNFPRLVLERIHYRIKDFDKAQRTELYNLIVDSCEFAPKVPRVIELANIVRARHREGPREVIPDTSERTPEVAQQAIAQIRSIFSKSPGGA